MPQESNDYLKKFVNEQSKIFSDLYQDFESLKDDDISLFSSIPKCSDIVAKSNKILSDDSFIILKESATAWGEFSRFCEKAEKKLESLKDKSKSAFGRSLSQLLSKRKMVLKGNYPNFESGFYNIRVNDSKKTNVTVDILYPKVWCGM